MVRRWFASCLCLLGLLPASWLCAQAPLGSLQIEPPVASDGMASSEFGWNRPVNGLASMDLEATDATLDRVHFLHWLPNPLAIRHSDPNDPARHVGLGHPLVGTSWRNRPFHVGWLVGGMFGDQLIEDRISQDEDLYGGYRLGWDFDHYWGTELRLSFSHLDVTDSMPLADPISRTSRDQFWDVNLMYYPWGDARWRPFVSLGVGAGDFYFQDETSQSVRETVVTFPLGAGLKYYHHNWLAWRLSVTDQWSPAAQGLGAMHNIALTAGVEMRFGGTRVGYYPYRAGRHLW